jgi:toxin ParE1/3/4
MIRYILSAEAAGDLIDIWQYIESRSRPEIADRVVAKIREKIDLLCDSPDIGHRRKDLTGDDVRFFAAYSYLIVYQPATKPLRIVSVLHGRRDIERILDDRV